MAAKTTPKKARKTIKAMPPQDTHSTSEVVECVQTIAAAWKEGGLPLDDFVVAVETVVASIKAGKDVREALNNCLPPLAKTSQKIGRKSPRKVRR